MQNFGKIPKWRTAWSGLIRLPLRPMQQTYELVFCINYYLHAHWQYSKFPGYFLLLLTTELRGFFFRSSRVKLWNVRSVIIFFSNRKQVRSNVFVVANNMFVKFDRVGFVFNIYVKENHKKKYFKGPKLGPKVSFFRSLPNFTDGLIIIFFLAWFN